MAQWLFFTDSGNKLPQSIDFIGRKFAFKRRHIALAVGNDANGLGSIGNMIERGGFAAGAIKTMT